MQALQLCENNHDETDSAKDAVHSTGYLLGQIDLSLAKQYGC